MYSMEMRITLEQLFNILLLNTTAAFTMTDPQQKQNIPSSTKMMIYSWTAVLG